MTSAHVPTTIEESKLSPMSARRPPQPDPERINLLKCIYFLGGLSVCRCYLGPVSCHGLDTVGGDELTLRLTIVVFVLVLVVVVFLGSLPPISTKS